MTPKDALGDLIQDAHAQGLIYVSPALNLAAERLIPLQEAERIIEAQERRINRLIMSPA